LAGYFRVEEETKCIVWKILKEFREREREREGNLMQQLLYESN
jgi:hypothetical protein